MEAGQGSAGSVQAPSTPASVGCQSKEGMLAEIAAEAGLHDKLTMISAKHGSVDTAVSVKYAVSYVQSCWVLGLANSISVANSCVCPAMLGRDELLLQAYHQPACLPWT